MVQQHEEIQAVYRHGPDGPSVTYSPTGRQYQAFTRRAPRSYAHQLSRDLVDVTRLLISLGLLLAVVFGITWMVSRLFGLVPLHVYAWVGGVVVALLLIGWVMGDD